MKKTNKFWSVIPAAGIGSRMGADTPKQYLSLLGKTILEHSLSRLASHPLISGVVVVLGADDPCWQTLDLRRYKKLYTTTGGSERCHSVLNGLSALAQHAAANDWVLVHDAARPCVHADDITRMIEQLRDHPVGGLLGLPVADTMKRSDRNGAVIETVSRENLWRALTPQMFRLGQLTTALQQALTDGFMVTDEASAMEHAGLRPQMVAGRGDNIKITRPEDLKLAELYLAQQEQQQ